MVRLTAAPSTAVTGICQPVPRHPTHRFNSTEDLSKTLHRYVWLYNQHLPQKALNHQTPLMAMKRWQESHPHLFKKKVISYPGPDT